jgi:hypothetical protein
MPAVSQSINFPHHCQGEISKENVIGLQTGQVSRRISKEFITTRTKRKNVRNKYLVSYQKGKQGRNKSIKNGNWIFELNKGRKK